MKNAFCYILILFVVISPVVSGERLVWPPAPDMARLEYVDMIDIPDLKIESSFLGKIKRFIGGKSESEQISLPFDIVVTDTSIFLTCQNIPALIEILRDESTYKIHTTKDGSLVYPISICDGDGILFLTDSESGTVFKFDGKELKPFITENLNRPTGIAALPQQKKIYVVDTGEHSLKIFDYKGNLMKTVTIIDDSLNFHYPTFVKSTWNGNILVNDALNYEIKKFDKDGMFLGSFGDEGDSPGTFSRPKGIAVDSEEHIYVVDNIFDNIQVFDESGRVLLVVGNRGREPGQFWSPAGIFIKQDTLYIADTFNNRIQILHYIGENN